MVDERVKELIEDMLDEYFYTNKLTSEKANEDNNVAVEVYIIGDKATFYLVKFKDIVIGSIYGDEERCIISNYSRRGYGESDNLKDGELREPTTH